MKMMSAKSAKNEFGLLLDTARRMEIRMKLPETQLVLMSTASQREDGAIV